MIPVFHAVLAAILGSGGSAAPAHQSRIPVITYGANALVQASGAVKESSNKNLKVTHKEDLKTNSKVIKNTDKTIKNEGKFNKTVKEDKVTPAYKESTIK